MAALLLPFVRRMIRGCTPLHLIEAPIAGSGKGLLANLICIVASGARGAAQTLPQEEAEVKKTLSAELATGRQIILLDNIEEKRRLSSPVLASILTTEKYRSRILGITAMMTVPNRATWIATANNPSLSQEIARRCIQIRIDPRMECPWRRDGFRHKDILGWAQSNRNQLLESIAILVQTWITAGKPNSDFRLGSFEHWSSVIGGILQSVNINGFLNNHRTMCETSDTETQMWREFVLNWWDKFKGLPTELKSLDSLCEQRDLLVSVRGEGNPRSQRTCLGIALSKMRDRTIGGYTITRIPPKSKHKGAAKYALESVSNDLDAREE